MLIACSSGEAAHLIAMLRLLRAAFAGLLAPHHPPCQELDELHAASVRAGAGTLGPRPLPRARARRGARRLHCADGDQAVPGGVLEAELGALRRRRPEEGRVRAVRERIG